MAVAQRWPLPAFGVKAVNTPPASAVRAARPSGVGTDAGGAARWRTGRLRRLRRVCAIVRRRCGLPQRTRTMDADHASSALTPNPNLPCGRVSGWQEHRPLVSTRCARADAHGPEPYAIRTRTWVSEPNRLGRDEGAQQGPPVSQEQLQRDTRPMGVAHAVHSVAPAWTPWDAVTCYTYTACGRRCARRNACVQAFPCSSQ